MYEYDEYGRVSGGANNMRSRRLGGGGGGRGGGQMEQIPDVWHFKNLLLIALSYTFSRKIKYSISFSN